MLRVLEIINMYGELLLYADVCCEMNWYKTYDRLDECYEATVYINTNTVVPPCSLIRYLRFTAAWEKKLESQRNKQFVSFKMHAKRELAVTWWNSATQKHPVIDSSSFVPVPTLKRRNPLLLYVREREKVHCKCTMWCTVQFIITLFNVGNALLCVIYQTLLYLCMLLEYHIIYSIQYYPRFCVTPVGLGTYYPWIRGHCCIYWSG
jgi:hypothetical protein